MSTFGIIQRERDKLREIELIWTYPTRFKKQAFVKKKKKTRLLIENMQELCASHPLHVFSRVLESK